MVLLGVVLAAVGALLAVLVYRGTVERVGVVVAARPLTAGDQIGPEDVRQVLLPPDTGLVTVPWTAVDTVVGRYAATDLHAGTTLTSDSITTERVPGPGEVVVGIAMDAGRVPSVPLEPRDAVLVIGDGIRIGATIVQAGAPALDGKRIVDVLVPVGDAESLTRAAMDGRVAVVLSQRR